MVYERARTRPFLILIPLLIGAAVSVALGIWGSVHTPTGEVPWANPFPSIYAFKVWLALGVLLLAAVQLVTALWMYEKFGLRRRPWVGPVHRTSGFLAFIVSLPVAAACLWALGFQTYSARVLTHSILGCIFYGAFVAKILVLHSKRLPGWALPAVAGLLLATVVGVITSSALYYIATFGLPK
ncbi:hypothetical protein DFJ67_0122 [Asanoa ferruginea]|uniref:Cytochrome b561 domain-containing protein n=1 Tax=Asanoa ferruginea TaxID=53367 RepID=A0A3D9ZAB5_9ACTN|nr:DUF6529 family protein [Asanoa ferruginea]REF94207.1 hypothetical protein DFJ67_0122 [Asanoa ferruginea]GIF49845.1 hypothetical protein Afe04nite_43840 [Asanoa ferruginea]